MLKRRLLYGQVLFVLLSFSILSAPPAIEADMNDRQRQAIEKVSEEAMLHIKEELQALGKKYPRLAETEKAEISKHPFHLSLAYQFNVRVIDVQPDSNGFISSSNKRIVVEENGIDLAVYLSKQPLKVGVTNSYDLPLVTKYGKLRLFYNLRANPEDEDLAKAIEDVMKSEADDLREQVHQITDREEEEYK